MKKDNGNRKKAQGMEEDNDTKKTRESNRDNSYIKKR